MDENSETSPLESTAQSTVEEYSTFRHQVPDIDEEGQSDAYAYHGENIILVHPMYDESRPLTAQVEEIYDDDENNDNEKPAEINIMDSIQNNPLFDRFQRTLKEHLLKIQKQLTEEIASLDNQLAESDREREELGAKLYDLQCVVDGQRSQIHNLNTEILNVSKKRQSHEESVVTLKRDFNQKSNNYKEAKRIHNEMLQELDNLQALEIEISKWNKEVKDEITVAKRIVSKDAQEKEKQAEEKRKMDIFLFNLDQEVRRREIELANINEQIAEQDVIIEDLNRSLADANSDLEILQNEHKRLFQSWREVIVAITQRDKVLTKSKDELHKEHQIQKVLQANIDKTRKATIREKETFDKMSNLKNRIVNDLMALERDFERDSDQNQKVLEQIEAFNALLEKTDEDFKQARSEGLVVENHLKRLRLQIERQNRQKYTLEEQILELLQDQISSDKASDYRAKLLRETQAKRRQLEINLSNTEGQLAMALLDLEKWKSVVARAKENIDRLEKEHDDIDEVSRSIDKDINDVKVQIEAKMRKLTLLNKELDRLIQLAGGQEINPLDMKVLELEKSIDETDQEIQNAQQFWLTLQSNVVNLSQKRTHQLNEIIIARKQLLVIEQRALKIESDLAKLQNENKETIRSLNILNNQFAQLNGRLYDKKKNHEKAEHQCQMTHQEINNRLEESEMVILQLEETIAQIQAEIEETKYIVMEKHHEALSWETKFKMAVETKKYRDVELASSSEIAMMKAEIHRMEVRHAQLKRAQEKLLQDLDNSVHQRGHIFDSANSREKISGYNTSKSRSIIQHKINEMKNKIKQLSHEITAAENGLVDIVGQQRKLESELETKKQELEDEHLQDKLIQEEIEQGMLLKQENLENIVRKQHRAKCYRKLLNTCQPYKRRNESTVNQEFERQLEAHEHLINIVEGLQQEFPDQKYVTTKILQTLKG
uniref:CSON002871 protein n=1 Tax=Culicoides sonorensis TaxID=179676 RepID=A0A336MNX6_CULSO